VPVMRRGQRPDQRPMTLMHVSGELELGTRLDSELVNTMRDAAIDTVQSCDSELIIYADCGAHNRWPSWRDRMQSTNLIRWMSRKRYSPDNAACEGFFGRLDPAAPARGKHSIDIYTGPKWSLR
jgi:transposase InsO family protein